MSVQTTIILILVTDEVIIIQKKIRTIFPGFGVKNT